MNSQLVSGEIKRLVIKKRRVFSCGSEIEKATSCAESRGMIYTLSLAVTDTSHCSRVGGRKKGRNSGVGPAHSF